MDVTPPDVYGSLAVSLRIAFEALCSARSWCDDVKEGELAAAIDSTNMIPELDRMSQEAWDMWEGVLMSFGDDYDNERGDADMIQHEYDYIDIRDEMRLYISVYGEGMKKCE